MKRVSTQMSVWKSHKADKKFEETKHDRGYNASATAKNILYYIFPAVIVSRTEEELEKAMVFSYDAPEVFMRHDLNWIFSEKYQREKRIKKFVRNNSVDRDYQNELDIVSPFNDGVEEMTILTKESIEQRPEILQNREVLSSAKLLAEWKSLKKQESAEVPEMITFALHFLLHFLVTLSF